MYVVSLLVDRNIFNSVSGSQAMFLSNVAAGNLKNNSIFNYKTGINILSSASYADMYNNHITGDSVGIQVNDGVINLAPIDWVYLGGYNRINSAENNINSENAYFNISEGYNTFNVNDSTSYHFDGTFSTNTTLYENAIYNCFKAFNTITSPREDIYCAANLSCVVNFEFNPTECAVDQVNEYIVFDLGDNVYDTIYTIGEGMGGAISSKINKSKIKEIETTNLKELYGSICLETRKRNFSLVHTKCTELLNNYIDSTESMDALSKLYLAALVLDSSGNKIPPLKTFYETLILENGENEPLVKKLFYLVQKCKVSLRQYESAMDGFEQIVNQNPYSYEGLVASWDYAATSLLDSIHGSGGGKKDVIWVRSDLEFEKSEDGNSKLNQSQFLTSKFQILNDDPKDKYDTRSFTKEDRKAIRVNVFKSLKTSRESEVEKIRTLETKIAEGKATRSEENELQTKKILSEIVKTKRPVDITEHIKFVNENIQVLFGSTDNTGSGNELKSIIPTEYNLSQNYPNPFNPVTRIQFDLPNNAKVKLVVYDLLGREVMSLVNNEFRTAGRYSIEFNGSNLSSGVYFYRLESEKFVQTKKMVLIK